MDCSLPGASVHGISQARILEWFPFPSPGDLPNLVIEPESPALAGGFFTTGPPGKPGIGGRSFKTLMLPGSLGETQSRFLGTR